MRDAAKVFVEHALVQALMEEITESVLSVMKDSCDPKDIIDAIADVLDDVLGRYVDDGDPPPVYEHDDVVRYLKAVRDGDMDLLPTELWVEVRHG